MTEIEASTTNSSSFLADFRTMSTFGATPGGGVDRQAATEADAETRRWFATWLESRGYEVRVDAIGNIFGLLTLVPDAPYVLAGSHLDSQPLAGRYDGAYGVLAAAHAASRAKESLADSDKPVYNLAVVDWFNEEGCRFKPSMMGSAVFTGKLDLVTALATRDPHGVSVEEALDAIGGRGTAARIEVAQYAEIHIEQGRELEEDNVTIGIVEGTWCAYKYEVVVTGEQSHTGSTRMEDRRDALLGAAKVVVAVNELTKQFDAGILHSSVGEFYVEPNSPVVVAREVRLLMDIRARTSSILNEAFTLLEHAVADIENDTRVSISIERSSVWESSAFDERGVSVTTNAADTLGMTHKRTLTLAGHDATNIKEQSPALLIFVPSVDGISHNEREYTSDDDLVAGVDLFTEVLRRLVCDEN